MKKFNIFPILIFIIFQLISCKPEPKMTVTYIPEVMKPYIIYPVGSYWIYQDSITQQTDSFYLKDYKLDVSERPDIEEHNTETTHYEWLYQQFYNKNSNNETAVAFTYIGYNMPLHYKNFYNANFRNDMAENEFILLDGDTLKKRKILDSVLIEGMLFQDVVILDFNNTKRTYWCKNIGMIRHEINNNSDSSIIYNLKKYYINN